jgi:hypothetical protein
VDVEEVLTGVAAWAAPPAADRRQRLPLVIGAFVLLALVGSVWLAGRGGDDSTEVDLLGVAEPTLTADPPTSAAVTTAPPPASTPATTGQPVGEATTTVAPPTIAVATTATTATTDSTVTTPAPAPAPATAPSRPASPAATSPTTTSTTTTTTTEVTGGALLAPSPPVLALTPGSSGTVRLSNVGPETASWSASPSVGLGVSPASGSLGVGRSVVLTISASSRASSGSVTVNGGVAPVSIAVDVAPPPSMPASTTSTTTTTTTEPGSTTTTTPVTIIDDDGGSLVGDGGGSGGGPVRPAP